MIGIFTQGTVELLQTIDVEQHPEGDFANPLKGLAWSADSNFLAVMFHHVSGGNRGHISIMRVETKEEISRIIIDEQYHCMEFSKDGTEIIAESDILAIP